MFSLTAEIMPTAFDEDIFFSIRTLNSNDDFSDMIH